MKQLTLNASPRKRQGSAGSGRLRAEGRVPAVSYGKSKDPTSLSVDASELRMLLRAIGDNTPVIQLKEGDADSKTTIIQAIQRHPITDKYLHVDFRQVGDEEHVVIEVPVHARGEPFGVKNENGTLEYNAHSVAVRCLPKDIPESIDLDVTSLKVGEVVHVNQLPALDGVEYRDHGDQPVVSVVV